MLLRCYRDGHDPKTADGWLPTDDAGVWADDGGLTVLGRRTEMIVSGGEKVWPAVVEAVLAAHPAVAEVAVAGRADPEWGEAVVAWVVPADATCPPSLATLRSFVAEQLPSYAAPRRLTLVDGLPRTALGKLVRHRLPGSTE
jgi:O-succinylbenzoic acid--CoA ligase